MQGIDHKQKEALWEKITQNQLAVLDDREQELLTGMLHSSAMIKALGRIYGFANNIPSGFVKMNLIDPKDLESAIRGQGQIQGYVGFIEALFSLVTLPEEIEDDSESADTA